MHQHFWDLIKTPSPFTNNKKLKFSQKNALTFLDCSPSGKKIQLKFFIWRSFLNAQPDHQTELSGGLVVSGHD